MAKITSFGSIVALSFVLVVLFTAAPIYHAAWVERFLNTASIAKGIFIASALVASLIVSVGIVQLKKSLGGQILATRKEISLLSLSAGIGSLVAVAYIVFEAPALYATSVILTIECLLIWLVLAFFSRE